MVVVYGQRKQKIDVVYLTSDEVLKGKITDSIPGVSITFQTLDKEYHFVPREDILRIAKEMYIKPGAQITEERTEYFNADKPSAYWLWIQGGGGLSLSVGQAGVAKLDLINGIRFENDLSVGVGIGARLSSNGNPLVPVYLQLQAPLDKGRFVPMFGLSIGTVANPDANWKIGGPMFGGDFGTQILLDSGNYLTFTLGYEYLSAKTTTSSGGTKMSTLNSLTLNLGLMF